MARTDSKWETINGGTAIQTIDPAGYDILINGTSKYLNFNTTVGSSGYGFRDNGGTMEFKNSGGSWTGIGTGGGGGTWGSITGTLSNQTDLQTALNAKANSAGALTQFVGNGNWKVWYSDGAGDVQELALGASGTFLKSNGASNAPTFAAPAGTGDMLASVYDPANIAEQLVGLTATQTLTNKTLTSPTINTGSFGTSITASYATLSTVPYFDASKNLVSSSVTPTELGYLSGVTSAVQTQINGKEPTIATAGVNTVWHGNKVFSAVVEADITLSANTTNDVSLTKHGFMSQLPGGTTLFYRADGSFATPASVAVPNGYLSEAFAYLANTVHSITHNFGAYPVVQAFDSTGNMVVPLVIQNTDANTVAVTFTSAATYTLVLTIGSPQLQSYTSTAIDYSAGVTDRIIAVTAGGKTVTLPTANVSRTGYEYKIDNSSTGTVNVVGQGGELIQGLASQTIPSDSCMTIYANGTAWRFN